MKRLLWLLPLAFALMWGGVLLETGRPTTAPRTTPAEPEAQEEAETPAPKPAVAVAPAEPEPEPEPEPSAEPPPPAAPLRMIEMRAAAMRTLAAQNARTADAVRVNGIVQSAAAAMKDVQVEASPEELLGEHGEGVTSPQFVQLETDYTSEPRDGAWAATEETRIAQLLGKDPIGKELALLNCQDSVCRIMLETKSKDAFERLLSVPGLAEATGLSSSSPYSLRSGQLSVYYRRPASASASSKTER